MKRPELKLVKDFKAGEFLLYWCDALTKERTSPLLHSMENAEEWWLKHQFNLYSGEERRATIVDRRKLHQERAKRATSSHFIGASPDGRRYTDRRIEVDEDRSRESMLKYLMN